MYELMSAPLPVMAERPSAVARLRARLDREPGHVVASFRALQEQQRQRRVLFRDELLPASIVPHFVDREVHQEWVRQLTQLFVDLEAIGADFLESPDLYDTLGLPDAARALIEIDPGYDKLAIVSRLDMVWDGDRSYVYEINVDSPAMMTFTDYLEDIIRSLFPLQGLEDVDPMPHRRTTVLHDALIECYQQWGGNKASPTIAIVDWRGQKTADELVATANEFTKLGSPSFVCDPRDLKIVNRKLTCNGREIDIVQRRVLFPEFLQRPDEIATLVEAYRRGLICMANPLRSYLLGNKCLLTLLSDERGRSAVGRQIVLPTVRVTPDNVNRFRQREDWVLKGALGHGGHEVLLGVEQSDEAWAEALDIAHRSLWVAQRYHRPPKLTVPIMTSDGIQERPLWANWNPFFFGGRFAGGMTRVSSEAIVSITANGALLPTLTTTP